MSAVSSESPHAAADLSAPSANPSTSGDPAEPGATDFGPNEWLVDELYQRYLADPGSVDRAWWSFFADYRPTRGNGTGPQPVIPQSSPAGTLVAPPPPPAPGPAAPGAPAAPQAPPSAVPPPAGAELSRLRGAAARTAQNMAASLSV